MNDSSMTFKIGSKFRCEAFYLCHISKLTEQRLKLEKQLDAVGLSNEQIIDLVCQVDECDLAVSALTDVLIDSMNKKVYSSQDMKVINENYSIDSVEYLERIIKNYMSKTLFFA